MRILVLLTLAILTGCATPYQDMGLSGGVTTQQMTSDTYRIVARGNGYTSRNTVRDYVMLKAAETTVKNGGTHFTVVSTTDASRTQQIVTGGGVARTNFYGNSATTRYTPATVNKFYKPGQDVYIKVFKVAGGLKPPQGAIEAAEIIKFVGPRVKRPK